jgi:glycosyltransferase involved in cell wall biosynthesis
MADLHLLVDARPISHPTAGGRGIGNYTLGLLHGLASIGASFTALVEHEEERLGIQDIPSTAVDTLGRDVVRAAPEGTWYLATGVFLHPLSYDPIPAIVTERRLPVAEVVHDVIPLQQPDVYLIDERARRLATLRSGLARTADLHVANSRYSASTATDVLRLDPRRVRVIGAGVDQRFSPPVIEDRRSVVAVTGADPRKNSEALLDAWARIDESLRQQHGLVIIAGVDEARAAEWRSRAVVLGIDDSVSVLRDASDDELVHHLQSAFLVVHPSLAEGFGLPVAEAAACGAPVICSNVTALPEVLDEPAAMFDPHEPQDIVRAIERGLSDVDHRAVLRSAAARAAARWQWPRAATELVSALVEASAERRRPRPMAPRLGIVMSPAAGHRIEIVRAMRRDVAVTLFDDRGSITEDEAWHGEPEWPVGALGPYRKWHEFDDVVTVIEGDARGSSAHVARRHPTHAWCAPGSLDPAVVAASRSVIVESVHAARGAQRLGGNVPPILVLPAPEGGRSIDDAAATLVDWVLRRHRRTPDAEIVNR